LGSSNYITNIAGEVSQHTEYFAFGETFVDEHKGSNNSPYKFNGKELDAESGLYYYGARYYDPRISIWASVDKPLIDGEYMNFEHDGGVLNSFNLAPYAYCRLSPVILIDPDGNQVYPKILNINKDKATQILKNQNYDDRKVNVNNNYKLSTEHAATMIGHEGVTLTMYDQDGKKGKNKEDIVGNATIGIGHLIHKGLIDGSNSEKDFEKGLTKDAVVKLFVSDLSKREDAVNKRLKKLDLELTEGQYAAIVDIAFNKGEGNANKVLNTLKNKGTEAAAKQIEKFDEKNKGLHKRRLETAKVFRGK
jgi:RHS repeat-associated protein